MNAVLLDSNRAPFDLAIQVTAGASYTCSIVATDSNGSSSAASSNAGWWICNANLTANLSSDPSAE